MSSYSFLDVAAAIVGPGGNIDLSDVGVAEEGIAFDMTEAKNTMVVGADGTVQHNLHAGRSGTCKITLLKTSGAHALLKQMYDLQTTSARYHGQNVIVVANRVSQDQYSATQVAFQKLPANAFNKAGPNMEWAFDCGYIDPTLGTGGAI